MKDYLDALFNSCLYGINKKQKRRHKMRRRIVIALTLALTVTAIPAFALTIVGTKHDLSVGSSNMGGAITGGSNQVCIYCHTPHNAIPAIPLWNRSAQSSTGYQFYSSPSMRIHQGAKSAFESTSISLMCMSCHNGVDGLGAIIKNKAGAASTTLTGANLSNNIQNDKIAAGNAKLGKDLTNDHPINFPVPVNTDGLTTVSGYTINGSAGIGMLTKALPLYKGNNSGAYIECASCHAVHDNQHTYFLRTTNTGSKLCLACHAK